MHKTVRQVSPVHNFAVCRDDRPASRPASSRTKRLSRDSKCEYEESRPPTLSSLSNITYRSGYFHPVAAVAQYWVIFGESWTEIWPVSTLSNIQDSPPVILSQLALQIVCINNDLDKLLMFSSNFPMDANKKYLILFKITETLSNLE